MNRLNASTTGAPLYEGVYGGKGPSTNAVRNMVKNQPVSNNLTGVGTKRKRGFLLSDEVGDLVMGSRINANVSDLRREFNRQVYDRRPTRQGKSNVGEMLTMANVPFPHPDIISNDLQLRRATIERGEPIFLLTNNIKDNSEKMDNFYQIYSANMLNYSLRKAHEHKEVLIQNGLTTTDNNRNNFNDDESDETELKDTETIRYDYASTVSEFNKKALFLGPYQSYDSPSKNRVTDAYSNMDQQYAVSSYCTEGPFPNLPNYFGLNKNGGYFIGLVLKKRNYLDFDKDVATQFDNPLQIYSWSSLKVKRPYIESSQYVYSSIISEIQQSILNTYRVDNNNNSRESENSIVEHIADNYNYTLHQMMMLHSEDAGTIDFTRDDNNKEEFEFTGDRYFDLGFHDVKVYRNKQGNVCIEPVHECGMFYKCGFVTMNENGKSLNYQQCDDALNDISGKSFIKAINRGKIAATIFT